MIFSRSVNYIILIQAVYLRHIKNHFHKYYHL